MYRQNDDSQGRTGLFQARCNFKPGKPWQTDIEQYDIRFQLPVQAQSGFAITGFPRNMDGGISGEYVAQSNPDEFMVIYDQQLDHFSPLEYDVSRFPRQLLLHCPTTVHPWTYAPAASGGRRLHSTASNDAHDPSGAVRFAHSPNRGRRVAFGSEGAYVDTDSKTLDELKRIRQIQENLLSGQTEALKLQREQLEMAKTQFDRAEKLNDRAEKIQDTSAKIMATARKALIVILPLIFFLLIYLSWLIFR
jgi:hypothetical protein